MAVQRTALWILMGACSLVAVAISIRRKRSAGCPESAVRRVGGYLSAIMDGLGIGLSAALLILLASALTVWIESSLH